MHAPKQGPCCYFGGMRLVEHAMKPTKSSAAKFPFLTFCPQQYFAYAFLCSNKSPIRFLMGLGLGQSNLILVPGCNHGSQAAKWLLPKMATFDPFPRGLLQALQ